jgi:hypothetical protein
VHISEDALNKAKSCLDDEFDNAAAGVGPPVDVDVDLDVNVNEPAKAAASITLNLDPVCNLSVGIGEICQGKYFYRLSEAGEEQGEVKFSSLKCMDESLSIQSVRKPPCTVGLNSLLDRASYSRGHLSDFKLEKKIREEDLHEAMKRLGYNMCTLDWVKHQYRMIIFKLSKYELMFPCLFTNRLVCSEGIYERLCSRYKKEFIQKKWSCIHEIFMLEVHCSHSMTLLVSNITDSDTVELTDGWYTINAKLDSLLTQKVSEEKLFIGTKIRVSMCQMQNLQAPGHPLEIAKEVFISLNYNAVFPARWDAKLGFTSNPVPLVSLGQIQPSGGLIPSTMVLVERQYPLVYMETLEDGSKKFRNQQAEDEAQDRYDCERQKLHDQVLQQMQREYSEEDCCDPDQVAKMQHDFDLRRDRVFREKGVFERKVSMMMKLRVSQVDARDESSSEERKRGTVTVWRPSEELRQVLSPGRIMKVTNLAPSFSNSKSVNLSSTPTSSWLAAGSRPLDPVVPSSLSEVRDMKRGVEFDFDGHLVCNENHDVLWVAEMEDETWLMRVDCRECGSSNKVPGKGGASLSFLGLSFDFADFANKIISCKAGLQAAILCPLPGVKNTLSDVKCHVERVNRLTHQ